MVRISKKRRFQTYYEFINIVFTSVEIEGQIYIPAVKWLLLAGCLILVIVFKTSSSLAAAYGIAVWVGIIAFAGLDAETGVVMLLYLDLAHEKWRKEGKLNSL
ncbi:MAG: KUP/HAK/KT family potassium transporter, partial [Syntrophobacterales bacterium]|nr:KUP/HAK/KT family potassium transporter [Syntrophobacterales bacterium]